MSKEIKITFQPSGRAVYVLPGTVLLEAAEQAGYILETPCGGAGKCGKCQVRVASGHCEPSPTERDVLGGVRFDQGWRLACQCRAVGPMTVEVPDSSLFQSNVQILDSGVGEPVEIKSRIRRQTVQLDPPSRDDATPDLERLLGALGPMAVDLPVLRSLPGALRQSGFQITSTIMDNRLVDVESGEVQGAMYGIAFDIGTTTLVGTLVDLATGTDVALASLVNPQTSFGDDVVTRIKRCREDKEGLQQLHESVLGAVNTIVGKLLKQSGVERRRVYEVVFAGNTTMQEILCGVDPSALGEMPFVPTFRAPITARASDLAVEINPSGDVHVFPNIGGFVGGDTVAGIVATRLDRRPETSLLVDVGTNGEIVLAHQGRMIATSVAAGPAFEGARIVAGMRAAHGAIEKVIVAEGDIRINVIGNAKPAGICGSGLIDAAAEMLRLGVLDSTGRILGPDEYPADLPPAIRARVREQNGQFSFMLAEKSASGSPLCLYQKDIRELQLANAAIRAGINILLAQEGLKASDLGSILLAGAFGNFIRRNNARRIGMLPQVPCDRIRFVGNTSSFGAKRVLLSSSEEAYAVEIMKKTVHVDLSLSPKFQDEFSESMMFPEGDLDASGGAC